jgi:hypothetical protein
VVSALVERRAEGLAPRPSRLGGAFGRSATEGPNL